MDTLNPFFLWQNLHPTPHLHSLSLPNLMMEFITILNPSELVI